MSANSKFPDPLPGPPIAKKISHRTDIHGDVLVDEYFWLRQKEDPQVIEHLNAENAYTQAMLQDVAPLRESLFTEMKARLKEDDAEVPYKDGAYFYYTRMEAGKQYPFYCRRRGTQDTFKSSPEEIVIDCNQLAEGKKYFRLGAYEVSTNHQWLAYAADYDGSEKYTIYFKNLATGELAPEVIAGVEASLEWANDNQTLFYIGFDESQRPDRIFRHNLGEEQAQDTLLYKETDSQLFVYCSKSRSQRYIFLEIQGKVTSEIHFIDADKPKDSFKVIEPRRRGVLYSATHHGSQFYLVTNDTVQNFRLVTAPLAEPSAANWQELRVGSSTLYIEDCEAFKDYLLVHERESGLPQRRVISLPSMQDHLIDFPEPAYSLGGQVNAEFDTEIYRFTYTSLVTPNTVYDYNLRTHDRTVRKTQEIPSGYDRTNYRSERIYATAKDGIKIPISLVYRVTNGEELKKDGSHPLYLYGYGSYGIPMSASFGTTRLSLIDRGFVFAIAHIRGGSEMGRQWYDDGKFLNKKNTFSDFITCAEHLIADGYTKKGEIAIAGGSAGGMLVGNVVNQNPDLFKAAVAHVPFVDVINTMLDETLPLTMTEYEEWGNPQDPVYYNYMKSYSPYDNVRAQDYPHMLVTSGLNDPRVTYWEPAKWVAKLREFKTDQKHLLQHINMGAGHGGPSGRYEALKETAMEYAFLLKVFDKM
jgi:oligopeptidase B